MKDGEVIGEITMLDDSGYWLEGCATPMSGGWSIAVNMGADLCVDQLRLFDASSEAGLNPFREGSIDNMYNGVDVETILNRQLIVHALLAQMVRYAEWEHCYDLCPMPDGLGVIEQ